MNSKSKENSINMFSFSGTDEVSFPLSAIVGMDDLVLGLLLAAKEPKLGGILLTGDKGTAKTTAARSLAKLLGNRPFVDLPLSVTEDRLLGSIDYSKVLKDKEFEYRPGMLTQANGGVLYVDEINLLAPYLTDALLDSQAQGYLNFQRDGLSLKIETKYVLIGSMNPEEGSLRPQLLDRFGLSINVFAPIDLDARKQIVINRLSYNENPSAFYENFKLEEEKFAKAINNNVNPEIPEEVIREAGILSTKAQVQGLRSDIVLVLAARAFAGLMGSEVVEPEHLFRVAPFVLNHRCRTDIKELIGDQSETSRLDGSKHPVETILNRDGYKSKSQPDRGNRSSYNTDDMRDSAYEEASGDIKSENDMDLNLGNTEQNSKNEDFQGKLVSNGSMNYAKSDDSEFNAQDDSTVETGYAGNTSDLQQVQRINNLLKVAKQRRKFSSETSNLLALSKFKSSYKLDDINSVDLAKSKISVIGTIFAAIMDNVRLNTDIEITYDHLRFAQHEDNNDIVVVLVLDISKSIGEAKRLDFAREFVNSVFQSIYQSRIKLTIYTFGKDRAELLCEPTGSVELIKDKLSGIKFEGNTPLHLALDMVFGDMLKLKSENKLPLVFVITDGKAKVSRQITWEKILSLASKFKVNQIMTSIIPIGETNDVSVALINDLRVAMGAEDIEVL